MLTWTLAHPWMTFWLIVILLMVIDNAISNIFSGCHQDDERQADE